MNETVTQIRLRRAKEALDYAREKEDIARKELASAVESRKALKKTYDKLFMSEENEEYARKKSDYRHATK